MGPEAADTAPADEQGEAQSVVHYPRGSSIGRFLVLGELGRGGMGVVYAAYDPDLDRKVALKLLRPDTYGSRHSQQGSVRLLREAQAMARVSHPNVAAIHDVGMVDDRVFLAMEYLDGQTLWAWNAEKLRPWRDVLAPFIAAGRGLAAAHAAGVVHRDFKPSNVIVTRRGVPKVTDFGLAKPVAAEPPEELDVRAAADDQMTQPGAAVGTPRYMAPEQRQGISDPRSDQWSFCCALEEALHGGAPAPRPVPRFVARALARGLSPDPDERFPSMDALLAALSHDPAARRRRVAAAVALVAVVAGGPLLYLRLTAAPPPCRGAEAQLAGAWDAPAKANVRKAFLASGVATADEAYQALERGLDAYATSWATMHRDACEATQVRGEQSQELLDLRMRCLAVRRQELGELASLLAQPDADAVRGAAQAAHKLAPLVECANAAALLAPVKPPADPAVQSKVAAVRLELAAADARSDLGRFRDAAELAGRAVPAARATGYRPVLAEALYTAGTTTSQAGDPDAGEKLLREATLVAEASRHDAISAEAWTALVFSVVMEGKAPERAAEWADRAAAAIERAGNERPLQARLANNRGAVAYTQGDFATALQHWEQALALARAAWGPDHPDVARQENNLGIVTDDLGRVEDAEGHYRRAIAIWEKAFGPRHPYVAAALSNLGSLRRQHGDSDGGIALLQRAIAIYEAALGPDHPNLADSLLNLGNALLPRKRFPEALAAYERSLRIRERSFGADAPEVASVLVSMGSAAREQGDPRRALELEQRALAIDVAKLGPRHAAVGVAHTAIGEAYLTLRDYRAAAAAYREALPIFEAAHGPDHVMTAYALGGLGRALLALGDARAALPLLERAVAVRTAAGDPQPLAESRLALARALWETGGDRARARRLAEDAQPALAGGQIDADLDAGAWLAAHAP